MPGATPIAASMEINSTIHDADALVLLQTYEWKGCEMNGMEGKAVTNSSLEERLEFESDFCSSCLRALSPHW